MVVGRVKEAAKRRWKIVRENQTVAGSSLRPDFLLEKDGHALLIDVTIPFENGPNAFAEAREAKLAKYEELANSLRCRYKSVSVEAIICWLTWIMGSSERPCSC